MGKFEKSKMRVSARILSSILVVVLAFSVVLPAQAATVKASDYAAVFDAAYYAARYPDLQAAFGNNEAALLNHFLACGMAEGRQGNAEFNVQYYKAAYADLRAVFGDNLVAYYMHYITCGKAEGRIANGTAPAGAAPAIPATTTPQSGVITGPTAVGATAEESEYAYRVLAIMNQIRTANGLGALSTTQELMNTAQLRADETVTLFSHTRPDGTSCFTAFDQNGVSYRTAGENIAAGQNSPEYVMECWMNSPGHRANILDGSFGHVGIGCSMAGGYYGIYWSQNFTN